MIKFTLLLARLLWRIREHFSVRPEYGALDDSYMPLTAEIDAALGDMDRWFSPKEIEYVKGYRAAPPTPVVHRSSATPPSLDRAPAAQPEEEDGEDGSEDPELLNRKTFLAPFVIAGFILIVYGSVTNFIAQRLNGTIVNLSEVVEAVAVPHHAGVP